jgi:hypothetical protein
MVVFRRWPRMSFFALGLTTATLCVWLLANWWEIARGVFGMAVVYDTRPTWLRVAMTALPWLPLSVLTALIAVRVARGPVVRPWTFAAGAATPYAFYALLLGTILLGPVIADHWQRRRS